MLGGGDDGVVLFNTAGHIQQANDNPVRGNSQEIVEVTTHALAAVNRGYRCVMQLGKFSLDRHSPRLSRRFVTEQSVH